MGEDQHLIRILVIDDDFECHKYVRQILEPHHCEYALNKQEGFKAFKLHCPDVVLLDMSLPDGSGIKLLEDMIYYDPEAFIVMLTASHLKQDIKEAYKMGAIGYIAKPFSASKLQTVVEQYHQYVKQLKSLAPQKRAEYILKHLHSDVSEKYRLHPKRKPKIRSKR